MILSLFAKDVIDESIYARAKNTHETKGTITLKLSFVQVSISTNPDLFVEIIIRLL